MWIKLENRSLYKAVCLVKPFFHKRLKMWQSYPQFGPW